MKTSRWLLAGLLLWVAAQVGVQSTARFWAAMGIVAGGGLALSLLPALGGWTSGKGSVIKLWTETMKCDGITKVSVSDGFATEISPNVELLTLKGTADGTCDGQKNGTLNQSAVYTMENGDWKLAFMFESPAM